jgi:hypothetical protein
MRVSRLVIAGLVLIVIAASFLTLLVFNVLPARDSGEVRPVPAGDQEIAWIDAATSSDVWERLVSALHNLEETWPTFHATGPALQVNYDRAFLELTADTPEIALHFGGPGSPRLWLRWYKSSSDAKPRSWIDKLARRGTPPLAVIGGDTSDRALRLASLLNEFRDRWPGPAPVFLITNATADRYDPDKNPVPDPVLNLPNWPLLMDVYKGRTFRFAFTNTRMAEAVMDFVQTHPDLWADGDREFSVFGFRFSGPLGGKTASRPDFSLYTLSWNDDRYSQDLSDRFASVFTNALPLSEGNISEKVAYSVGDFYQPNPSEVLAVDRLLLGRLQSPNRRQLLVLPTSAQPARRFLRTLVRRAPLDVRSLVAVTGDSITFDTIYRDRDTAWNVLDLPVPLVLFSHRNPVDETSGFRDKADPDHPASTTGTQDLLLHRDLMEALLEAAFRGSELLQDADAVERRLRETRWVKGRVFAANRSDGAQAGGVPLFSADGDRQPRTGEHIVWLKPLLDGEHTLPEAEITVWRLRSEDKSSGWRPVPGSPFHVNYERGR